MSGNTEMLHHPLVAHVAQDREVYQMNYIMSGLNELQSITYQDSSITGATNPSSAYFNIKPPYGSIMDRNILLELQVQVTAGGGTTNIGDYFCPKSMPANRLIDTCQLKINSSAITSEPSKYVSALSQYKTNQEFLKKFRSLSPTEPDHVNRYSNCAVYSCFKAINTNATNAGLNPATMNTQAWGDAPLSPFSNSSRSAYDYDCRGAFPYKRTSATQRTYTFTEPLLNPFCMQREDTACSHVTDLTVQLNFTSQMERAFSQIFEIAQRPCSTTGDTLNTSHSFDTTGTQSANLAQGGGTFTVSIISAKLIVKMGTPSIPLSIKQAVQYNEFQPMTQALTTDFSDGSAKTVTFTTQRLSCIPSHIFIYARPALSIQNRYQADAFLAISNVNITINNKAGILSNMTQAQLYNMSVENGVNMSWGQWSQRVGSILCLAMGRDVVQLLPGCLEVMDITFSVTLQNTTLFDYSGGSYLGAGATTAPVLADQLDKSITSWELVLLNVYPATLTLEDNFAAKNIGITAAEAADAIREGPSVRPLNEVSQATGGSFGDWLHRTAHSGWHAVKKYAGPVAHMVANVAGAVPVVGSLAHLAADSLSHGSGALGGSRRQPRGRGLLLN